MAGSQTVYNRLGSGDNRFSPAIRSGQGVFFPRSFFRKDLFEPMRLLRGDPPIRERELVSNDELLPTTVTSDNAHFLESGPILPSLTRLYDDCPHLLTFSSLASRRSHKAADGFRAPAGARQKVEGVPRGKTDGLSCLLRIEIGLAL
jgi:hypothetical protein